MIGTAAAFIAQLEARLGHPYSETIDGGVGPEYYDCSGLVMVCLDAIGINYTRTTYSQWADPRYLHLPAGTPMQVGDVVYMHVAGEADPGHVGVYVGNGEYINAPHTGAVVRIEPISSTVSEHVFGIIRPPFASVPTPTPQPAPNPTPAPTPAPTPQEDDEMQMVEYDPKTGGYWATDENGANYAGGGAPFIPGLNTHPDYHAGAAESIDSNPCVGITYWAAFGNDGIIYFTKPSNGVGGWAGTPYSTYRFLRDGTPA